VVARLVAELLVLALEERIVRQAGDGAVQVVAHPFMGQEGRHQVSHERTVESRAGHEGGQSVR
jgi:hypothetical protein